MPRLETLARLVEDAAAREVMTLGAPWLDSTFTGGGLPARGAHEIAGRGARDAGAALGFGLALLARLLACKESTKAILVQEAMAGHESGRLYAQGLNAFGIDPDRLLMVFVRRAGEALWTVNEALKSGAVAAVLAELWDGAGLDLSATRRFNLAAERTGALALLITRDLSNTSAAFTRWQVAAAPSRGASRFIGRPAFSLALRRNRHGRTGEWTVEWDSHAHAFIAIAADPVGLAPPAFDRPHRTAGAEPWRRVLGEADAARRLRETG